MKPALLALSALAIALTAAVAVAAVHRLVDRTLMPAAATNDLIAIAIGIAGSIDTGRPIRTPDVAAPPHTPRYTIVDTLPFWRGDDHSAAARSTIVVEWSPASGPPHRGAIYLRGESIVGVELLLRGRLNGE
ncbi:MAG: hypothetical protein EA382_02280 [Spirochaetaceae bacterium]|nr:MAG: hypothetical protein EA382_02280 [Spirochaetaceae bacterium]